MRDVLREIESIRRTTRLLLLAQRWAVLLAWLIGAALALVFADYLLRFPAGVRLALGAGVVLALLGALWRYVSPALRFRPTLTDLALRFERLVPSLRGYLASGVDFAMHDEAQRSPLAAQAVAEAEQRAGRENLRSLVNPRRTLSDLGAFALAAAVMATLGLTMPGAASIAAQRWFNPFGEARWLKRTGVESAMAQSVHPRGKALPLQARVTRGLSEDMRVSAHFRLWRDGDAGTWQQVILTQQRDGLFERLIEPDADRIDVRFSSQDDETPVQSIAIVPPPRIERAEIVLEPPAYAARIIGESTVDLGTGTDERAVLAPAALVGTRAALTLTFNKPVPTDPASPDWKSVLRWEIDAEHGAADDDARLSARLDDDGRAAAWTIAWTLGATTRLQPVPVDEHGLAGPDDVGFRIESRLDVPPGVSILEPASDRTCLPRAYVDLRAEARDDVLVEALVLEATVNDAAEARTIASLSGSTTLEQLNETLDLSMLDVKPGDVVTIVAAATDTFALNGAVHERALSSPRRLRIITDAEFVEQIYENLSAVRDSAIRIEQEQRDLMQRLERGQTRAGDLRDQSRIGQQIDRQREALAQIAARVRDNRLGDRELEDLMAEAGESLARAGQSSNEASERLSQAQQAPEDETEQRAQQRERERAGAQQRVSDELTSLIELLDRGEDSWVMRRQVEQLLTDQQNLEREGRQATDRTRGLDPSQLTEEQRRALDEFSRRQEELARRGERLVDELRQRAEQMQRTDPDLADAMREAMEQAQSRQLEQRMSEAAEQLRQNQGQRASEQQQQAMETLQSMLNQLESTDRARAERLARQLESLLQSLEALVLGQEAQLAALAAAQGRFEGLDRAMLQLNTNTYAVLDLAVEGGRDLAEVARHVESAAAAQEQAVVALRADPVDADGAQRAETESLTHLQEARRLAAELQQRLQEQQQQRRRQELAQAYRDLHERQTALIAETSPLTGVELDRRQRVMARQLGNQQAQIRVDSMDLLRRTEDLAESFVFEASHNQIDALAATVVEDLRAAEVGPAQLMREQDIADRFLALALALQDSPSNREFEEPGDESGGGGGQGGGGQPPALVPPIAQLKLLRSLQDAVYRSTRLLDERGGDLGAADRSGRIDELGRAQRELTDLGRRLIEEMSQRAGGEARPGPPPEGERP